VRGDFDMKRFQFDSEDEDEQDDEHESLLFPSPQPLSPRGGSTMKSCVGRGKGFLRRGRSMRQGERDGGQFPFPPDVTWGLLAGMDETVVPKLRVVLLDIYHTLLAVEAPPPDAGRRWCALWTETLQCAPRLKLEDVAKATQAVIQQHHGVARALGIPCPEVSWPDVMREAVPELVRISDAELDEFLFRHVQLQRAVHLMSGAAGFLHQVLEGRLTLGLVSNAQAYTLRELDLALAEAGMNRSIFRPDLCFLSFQNGYSKPDPHVFRSLGARLRTEGILPEQILMVGDREDNDIQPARAQGWQGWRLTTSPSPDGREWGDYTQLIGSLKRINRGG
jgi:FMN phosphatase YigB (HAD superfamily)